MEEKQVPLVDRDLCISCGDCLAVCPYEVLALDEEKIAYVANPEACERYGACAEVCPTAAISLPWAEG